LEQRVAPKHGPRHILVTNVCPDPETGYSLELAEGLYADVWGAPLSPDEIEELREKYRRDRK
jgi:hypothetical protein